MTDITSWKEAHEASLDLLRFLRAEIEADAVKTIDETPFVYYDLAPIERKLTKVQQGLRTQWIRAQQNARREAQESAK